MSLAPFKVFVSGPTTVEILVSADSVDSVVTALRSYAIACTVETRTHETKGQLSEEDTIVATAQWGKVFNVLASHPW